jgi:hypothetical protein
MAGRGHARPSKELARSIGERRRGGELDTGCREVGRGDEASHEAVPFGGAAAVRDAKYVTLAARRRQFAIGARPPPVRRPRPMAGMTRNLRDRLDGWRGEQIELLERLVNHDRGTDDPIDVNRVGAIPVDRLDRLACSIERVAQERFGDHLVGQQPGAGPDPTYS